MANTRFAGNQDDAQMLECGKYYDLLDDFAKAVNAANLCAEEKGMSMKVLQNKMFKLLPAFYSLCGGDAMVQKQKKQMHVRSSLEVRDGWGLCPECGKKCIRVQNDTVLVKYPMFCKACKKENVVSWRYRK